MEPIVNALKYVFNMINSVVPNLGIDIILFTILFKIVLLPLNIKQTKTTIKTQALQPKLKELQKKYKGDPKKLQEAQAELYKSEGVNPLAGCLPLLIQLPILWAVFYVFRDVSLFGDAQFLGLTLSKNISTVGYVGIFFAILSGATTFLSTWLLAPKNKDAGPMAASSTNIIMSVFFGWISWTMPAGLVIYWIVNNVLQIVVQYMLNKAIAKQLEVASTK